MKYRDRPRQYLNLRTSGEIVNDVVNGAKIQIAKFSSHLFLSKCNSKVAAFCITTTAWELWSASLRWKREPVQSYCPPTLSNLSATIPFNIALFISIFIAHYNVALLKKAIDFRIDRGESQLFGSICRRIHSTYTRQRRLLPHSNQW